MKFKKFSYYSFFYPDNEMKKTINIEFPDLPGCISCGYGYSQARKFARAALSLYLDGMKLSDVPKPSGAVTDSIHRQNMEIVKVTVVMLEKKGVLWGFGIKRF